MRRFRPGEPITLRELWRGRVWAARALTMVRDGDDAQMFHLPSGAPALAPSRADRLLREPVEEWELVERAWDHGPVLSFAWPDVAHAVLLLTRRDGTPRCWYVQLQDPLRRTRIGFDTVDHVLDAIVELDGGWRWKDEGALEAAVARGDFTADQALAFRAEGERGVARIVEREPPFDRDWWSWRPDPSWPAPTLPAGADRH